MPRKAKIPLHKHLLINGRTQTPPKSKRKLKKWLCRLVRDIGMKRIGGPFVRYVRAEGNRGLTAVAMIETSHIALHVWEEGDQPYFRFDLYTCGELDHVTVLGEVARFMGAPEMEWIAYDREDGFSEYDSGCWPLHQSPDPAL
jgi:S-adenosylmethionine/arginine decarboxylase-like enzyme